MIIGGFFILAAFIAITIVGFRLTAEVTRITDDSITTQNFNMAGGRFSQDVEVISEVGYIQDDNQGGDGNYIDKPRGVVVIGKYLYSLSLQEDAFCIYEVSKRDSINEISCIVNGSGATQLDNPKNLYVLGKYAYVISNSADSLSVFDISNPTNITEVGTIVDDNKGGSATGIDGPEDLYVSGRYAYISGYNEHALSIIDISNPTKMFEVSVLRDGVEGSQFLGLATMVSRGHYLYVLAKTDDSFSIVDISDPENPFETDYIQDDVQGGNATALDGAVGIIVSGRYAYVASAVSDSLSVFDISNKSNITEVATLIDGIDADYLDGASRLVISGKYLYVLAKDDDAISVIDISDPENPFETDYAQDEGQGGSIAHLDQPLYLFLSGRYLYVTVNVDDAIVAFEVSGLNTPAMDIGVIRTNFLQVVGDVIIRGDLNLFGNFNLGGDLVASGTMSSFGVGDNYFRGKIGIGTTTPQNELNVIGNVNVTGNYTNNANIGITGNYTSGSCWTSYSGGIVYETNCTST